MPLENILTQINTVHTLFIWDLLLSFSKLCLCQPSDLFLNAFQLKVCMNLPYTSIPCVLIFPPISTSQTRSLLLIDMAERITNHEAPHYSSPSIALPNSLPSVLGSQTFNSWKSEVLTNTIKQQITQHSKKCSSSVLSLPQTKRNKSSPSMQVLWRSGGKSPFILNLGNGWGGVKLPSSRPGSLYPGKISPGTLCT